MSYTNSIVMKAKQVLPSEESNIMYHHNYRKNIRELNEMLLDQYKNHWYIAPMIVREKETENFSIHTETVIIHYHEPIDLIMVGKTIAIYRALQKK